MTSGWPSWAAETIEIVTADPGWPSLAAELASDLERLLAPWLAGKIEHIGSTAVPDLVAKPVIDLMAPVRSLDAVQHAHPPLSGAGWCLVPPELDQRAWRRFYVLPEGDRRRAHLHLVESTHPRWRDALVFRDHLRRRPDLSARYAGLKLQAARSHRGDRERYTAAKASFIRAIVAAARATPQADGGAGEHE